jgi:hypothetical protein
MSQIVVKVRSDIGDPGTHHKHGPLIAGTEISIEEEDFGAGLFERPSPDYLSPLELADQAKGKAEKCSVGTYEHIEEEPPVEAPVSGKSSRKTSPGVNEEVPLA